VTDVGDLDLLNVSPADPIDWVIPALIAAILPLGSMMQEAKSVNTVTKSVWENVSDLDQATVPAAGMLGTDHFV